MISDECRECEGVGRRAVRDAVGEVVLGRWEDCASCEGTGYAGRVVDPDADRDARDDR